MPAPMPTITSCVAAAVQSPTWTAARTGPRRCSPPPHSASALTTPRSSSAGCARTAPPATDRSVTATEPQPLPDGVALGEDGVARCAWAGSAPDYVAYHDTEWGFPSDDDVRLFE